jgi:hypothetical protein
MNCKPFLVSILLISLSFCNQHGVAKNELLPNVNKDENPFAFISTIPLPEGFNRIKASDNSFANWLRNISLKKDKTVYTYNNQPKGNQHAQFAVLDISAGNKDLQQCADAVIRLRAEYLFAQKQFEEISFRDNSGKIYPFTKPYNRDNFMRYLDRVFGMCGSSSLSKQLKPVNEFRMMEIGDVLIRGGFPGHAEMVVDMAENLKGEKIYLLAQGFMPAQDIHVLVNPANKNLSPWYSVNDEPIIETPEYTFYTRELKKW